jgi:hypothetical protein
LRARLGHVTGRVVLEVRVDHPVFLVEVVEEGTEVPRVYSLVSLDKPVKQVPSAGLGELEERVVRGESVMEALEEMGPLVVTAPMRSGGLAELL